MRFDKEKKNSIILYILEKISQKTENLSKHVSEACNLNQNTVHTYINQLVDSNIIRRVKRGEYELVKTTDKYFLKKNKGELDSDTYAYNTFLKNYIKDMPQNIQMIWNYTLSEMMNNVMDHSEATDVLLIIEKDYLNTSVLIADNGIGIFNKIKDYFNLDSLDEAICELFKGKLTTDSSRHSGEGIFFSSKIMDNFLIVSSEKIFTCNKYDESTISDISNLVENGTGVFMSLSNHSNKEIHEVFDLYSNTDGGFTKTTIPLKNIFDSSPVSRSQARRVCNRLDKFKEVILDFDSIDWMGQGFAHQIFVLFKNEHPEIIISAQNMNELVEKMYVHVISSASE